MELEDFHRILCSLAAGLWTVAADFWTSPPCLSEGQLEDLNRLWRRRQKGADTVLPYQYSPGHDVPCSVLLMPLTGAGGAE